MPRPDGQLALEAALERALGEPLRRRSAVGELVKLARRPGGVRLLLVADQLEVEIHQLEAEIDPRQITFEQWASGHMPPGHYYTGDPALTDPALRAAREICELRTNTGHLTLEQMQAVAALGFPLWVTK